MTISSVPSILRPAARKSSHADDIDYEIKGHEMQFVEIELDPHESVIAEAGGMMFKPASVQMDTIFGDGSKPETGFFGKLASHDLAVSLGQGRRRVDRAKGCVLVRG
jgi:Mitochondrial biogenesis AIM24